MVPSLRILHRRIWLILAIVLPLIFVAALMAIERPRTNAGADGASAKALTQVNSSGQSELLGVVIRSEAGAAIYQQIEIRVKKAQAAPESLLYLDANNSAYLIGRLTTRGIHRYDISSLKLSNTTKVSVRLLDPIKKRDIHIVHLQNP